jgi:hypothetical protein
MLLIQGLDQEWEKDVKGSKLTKVGEDIRWKFYIYSPFREVYPLKQIYGNVKKWRGNIKNVRFPQGK